MPAEAGIQYSPRYENIPSDCGYWIIRLRG